MTTFIDTDGIDWTPENLVGNAEENWHELVEKDDYVSKIEFLRDNVEGTLECMLDDKLLTRAECDALATEAHKLIDGGRS